MSKYIIKNCPAYNEKGCLYEAAIFPSKDMKNRYITFSTDCQDCTDCLLKQIVELCKEENYAWLAKEILLKLDIQEVE